MQYNYWFIYFSIIFIGFITYFFAKQFFRSKTSKNSLILKLIRVLVICIICYLGIFNSIYRNYPKIDNVRETFAKKYRVVVRENNIDIYKASLLTNNKIILYYRINGITPSLLQDYDINKLILKDDINNTFLLDGISENVGLLSTAGIFEFSAKSNSNKRVDLSNLTLDFIN